MKKKLKWFSILFFITMITFSLNLTSKVKAEDENDIKNVLVINSYHQGLAWSEEELEGITDTIKASGNNINLLIEYMDWKSYPTQKNLEYLSNYYKYKYQNKKIDLIVATDDAALQFSLANRAEMFSDAPVIFCGVNKDGVDNITEGFDRVTGVIEVVDPTATLQLALKINPSLKYVYVLYDNTESGITTGQLVINKMNEEFPELMALSLNNMSYESVENTVKDLNQDSIIIMTSYSTDVNLKVMEMDYVIRDICSISNVPVYHLYDFGLNNGILGGALLSGREQGEYAGSLALRVLAGEDPNSIPVFTPESNREVIDYQQLNKYRISLKLIPKNYEILNKPFSFFETYRSYVIRVLVVIIVLLAFINVLLIYIRRIRRMKRNLVENHEELTQLYEELTASDEEMKQQYDEILDINEKIRIGEEKLSYLAYHDTLTGLPNKLSLYENSTHIFQPENGKSVLLFVDIDNFKNVNDTLGHAFGDQLIKEVSERLTSIFPEMDTIYRLSGDEFIILIQKIEKDNEIQKIASDILTKFSEEFNIQGSILHVSVSIGIAIYPEHGKRLEQLLKYADIAMYRVKESGRKSYIVYNSLMSEEFMERVNIEKYLHKAQENGEFELYYQPQLDLKTNKVTGFEALLRWHSPELGDISPLKFIKIAEDTRLIIPLGKWVLGEACAFIKRLHSRGYGDFQISVNISIIQLLQNDFCESINDTLRQYDLSPELLELEITETILMESIDSIGNELKKLKQRNIKIALDDFGKGYSSLNYLRQLPISTLKIDKSFVDCILEDYEDTLTGQIVIMGKSMGMNIIAEGVEKQEQLDYLLSYECDKVQGYLYSKPKPEAEIIKLLEVSRDKRMI